MRSIIETLPVAIREPENYEARSNLMWASTMAEIGIIKLGKQCDFEAHMIEHQMGAYTDCNHGMGLGVIHPVLSSNLPGRHQEICEICRKCLGNVTRWRR